MQHNYKSYLIIYTHAHEICHTNRLPKFFENRFSFHGDISLFLWFVDDLWPAFCKQTHR